MKKSNSLYKAFLEAKRRIKTPISKRSVLHETVTFVSKKTEEDIDRILLLFVDKGFKELKAIIEPAIREELEKTYYNSSFSGASTYVSIRKKPGNKDTLIVYFYVSDSSGKGHYIWHIINAGRSGVDRDGAYETYKYPKAVSKAPAVFNPYKPGANAPRTHRSDKRGVISETLPRNARDPKRLTVIPKGEIMPSISPRDYYTTVVEKIEDIIKEYNKKSDLINFVIKHKKINNWHKNKPGVRMELTWE